MRALSLGVLLVSSACLPVGESVSLPEELALSFLVPVNPTGNIQRPILGPFTAASEQTIAVPRDTQLVVVGWSQAELLELHPRFAPDQAEEVRLVAARVTPEQCPTGRLEREAGAYVLELPLGAGPVRQMLSGEPVGSELRGELNALALRVPLAPQCRGQVDLEVRPFADAVRYLREGQELLGGTLSYNSAAGLFSAKRVYHVDADHVVVAADWATLFLERGRTIRERGVHVSTDDFGAHGLAVGSFAGSALGRVSEAGPAAFFMVTEDKERFDDGIRKPVRTTLAEAEVDASGLRWARTIYDTGPPVDGVQRELRGLYADDRFEDRVELIAVGTELMRWNGTSSSSEAWPNDLLAFVGSSGIPEQPHVLGSGRAALWLGTVEPEASGFERFQAQLGASEVRMIRPGREGGFLVLTAERLSYGPTLDSLERVRLRVVPDATMCIPSLVDECGWAEVPPNGYHDVQEYADGRVFVTSRFCGALFRVTIETGCVDVIPLQSEAFLSDEDLNGLRGMSLAEDGSLLVIGNPGELYELVPR